MKIVIIGLSITSSWGNGHATTYRSLVAGLAPFGQDVLFLEQDRPWYAAHRDMAHPPFCQTVLYANAADLAAHADAVAAADLVVVGSYVADGPAVCPDGAGDGAGRAGVLRHRHAGDPGGPGAEPVRLHHARTDRRLRPLSLVHRRPDPARDRAAVRRQDGTGAVLLGRPGLERAGPGHHAQLGPGYLGTYSLDRQPTLDHLLCTPARLWPEGRFNVHRAAVPVHSPLPANVDRSEHSAPSEHRAFYASQRFTLISPGRT